MDENERKEANRKEFEAIKGLLGQMADGIAGQFGGNCEVLVHDLTGDIEHSVAIIKNGRVSGRAIGDPASAAVLQALSGEASRDRYGYFTNTKNGKMLKSSTLNVRGKTGDVIALFCINYDISDFTMAEKVLADFVGTSAGDIKTIPVSVTDLLDQMIEESHRLTGKPIPLMTKEEKKDAIIDLERKGALLIRGSSDRIADYYGISKFTLYSYLSKEDAKNEQKSG